MGRIAAPFGVQGWLKVQPSTSEPKGLLGYKTWWVGRGEEWREHEVREAKVHGRTVVARLDGCEDRDAAARFRGQEVAISRTQFPATKAQEYYWTDLIGLGVVNETGQSYGQVTDMLETGANDVLVVQGERERLIPFIAAVIAEVDLVAGVIRVNWDADY
jgi:16S rRNA processing protein RimM